MFGVPIWAALAALFFLALLTRNGGMAWAAFCIFGNWVANTVLANATGTQFNWLAMAAIDYCTGIIVLCPPVTRSKVAIAGLYVLEIIGHISFAISGGGRMQKINYWWFLHYALWGQALCLLGGIGGDAAKSAWNRGRARRRLQPVLALFASLGSRRERAGVKPDA